MLRKKDYEVRTVPLATCRELVARYHYAGGGSNTATFRHGLFRRDSDECVGIAWWIPPTKSAAFANYPKNWRAVLVLSRLVVHPDEPQNAASFLIAQSVRLIKKDPRWQYLLTYADEWQNHSGAIYKATNWTPLGRTTPEATWVSSAGRMVARKAGPHTRTKDEMTMLGHTMIGRHARLRFGMQL